MKHSLFNRFISMLITVTMLLTMVPAAFAATPDQFVDFPTGWSKDAMTFSVDNDLIRGKSANKIDPASNLTRAEMATIINRAFGAEITGDISSYTDVKTSDWFYTEMQKAVNMQTFQGDGNGKLRPNDAITREEVMAVIARAIVLETSDYSSITKFKDYSSVSDWAKPYVASLISGGYVNGYEDGTVRPKANITREEFAQLMYNIFKTYLTEQGTTYTSVYNQDCVMINNKGINLKNVTINGDLVLGDGVGTSNINLTNVTIKGRLVARGGVITLKNVTTGGGVVVKNVNGTTHFNNYRTDSVFDGVIEHTYTTYLTPSFSTGGGKPGTIVTMYDVTVNYYYQDSTGAYVLEPGETLNYSIAYGQTYTLVPSTRDKYVFNAQQSDVDSDSSRITVTGSREINLYYDKLFSVSLTHPTETTVTKDVVYGTTIGDAYTGSGLSLDSTVTIGDNTYDVKWVVDGNEVEPTTPITGDVTVGYKLIATINVDYDNGDSNGIFKAEVNPSTKEYSLSEALAVEPTKEHYDFAGWFDESDVEYNSTSVVTKTPLNLKAKWTGKKYDLVLETNGGTIDPSYGEYDKYTYGAGKTLPDATYMSKTDGSTFAGWYDNPECTGATVTTIPADANGTKTYYAKWNDPSVVTHAVSFDINGDGIIEPGIDSVVYIPYNTPVSKPSDPVKDGWKFMFWSVDGTTEYDFATPVTAPITIKAIYVKEHTVTFVYDNGDANSTTPVLDGETVTKPADPTKDGWYFRFWSLDGINAYDFNAPVTGDITLTAIWAQDVPDTYVVTFVYGNGEPNGTQNVVAGGKATKPADPVWEDYKFEYWTADGINAYDFNTPVTGNITLTAVWTKYHTVTFKYDNGDADTTQNVLDGQTATKPADPTKENHTFKYWSLDGVNEYDFTTPVTAPITLTALWAFVDPTVKHTVNFYMFPKDTDVEYVGSLDVVENTAVGNEDDGTINADVKALYLGIEDGDTQKYTYDLWEYNTSADISYVTKGYVDDAEGYTHYIRPELVYLDTDGKWKVFNGETLVVADMDVYAVKKVFSMYMEGSLLGIDLPSMGATLSTPYNSATRAVDSLKDAMYRSRNSFNTAFTEEFEKKIYSKIAPKSKGLIDENGYLQNFEYSMLIADVVSVSEIEGEIRNYIIDLVEHTGTDSEIDVIINIIGADAIIDHYGKQQIEDLIGVKNPGETDNEYLIRLFKHLRSIESIEQLADEAFEMLKEDGFYTEFINAFKNKKSSYHIDHYNVHFMVGVANAVAKYDFDEAMQLLGGGNVYDLINKLGRDNFEQIYLDARDEFCNNVALLHNDICVNGNTSASIDTELSLGMKINFADLINQYYTKLHDKLVVKVENAAPYYYNENQYLKDFVAGIRFDEFFDYNASVVTEVNSGYKFKTIMEYYDLLYDNLLLVDKAVLWYGPNTPEEMENLRDDVANDIIKAFNKLQSILEGLDEDGSIFGGYTIKDVIAKVESLKKLGAEVPALKTVIDNVCTILAKVEGGEVIAGGYTLDDLAALSDRLESAVATLRDEDYEKLNAELADVIDKAISKAQEIIKELDEDGTILGKVSLDELMAKVDAINNIYKKFESKIDALIGKLADLEIGSAEGKVDTEYWEDVLFGEDDYNRFDLDDIFNIAGPKLDEIRVNNPIPWGNKITIIDEFKVSGGGATVKVDRYFN